VAGDERKGSALVGGGVERMDIAVAHAAECHPDVNVVGAKISSGDGNRMKRRAGVGCLESESLHGASLPTSW
jgi:hypothetical protein